MMIDELTRGSRGPLLIALAGIGILGTALSSQFFGGLNPCHLCMYQRGPYAFVIPAAMLAASLVLAGRDRAAAAITALCSAAFVIGAVVAGMGGLMFAWHISAFAPSDFAPIISFYAFVIVLLSGTGRMWATPIGALLFSFVFTGTRFFEFWPFTLVDSIDRQYVRILMIGVILIGIMLFRPQGLFGRRQESLL